MLETSDNIFILLLSCTIGAFFLVTSFLIIQVRNQNRIFMQKKKLDEAEIIHQKDLLHSIIQSQEEERKRIGQNLHDEVGGSLAVLRMLLSSQDTTSVNIPLIEKVIETVRTISHRLSPQMMSFLGLCDTLEELCENLTKTGKIEARFECDEIFRSSQWHENSALAIYRVLQELVANTLKHAEATLVKLNFEIRDGTIIIQYRDNGRGIKPNIKKGLGTANIVSRLEMLGADWEINPEKKIGYHIRINMPYASVIDT